MKKNWSDCEYKERCLLKAELDFYKKTCDRLFDTLEDVKALLEKKGLLSEFCGFRREDLKE